MNNMTSMSAPPIAMAGWRHANPARPRLSLTGGNRSGSSGAAAIITGVAAVVTVGGSIPDPRVENRVEDVDDQVDQDVDKAEQQHDALYDGIIAAQDGVDGQAANS